MTRSELIEAMARRLAAHSWEMSGNENAGAKPPVIDRRWHLFAPQAEAALSAIEQAGFAVVDRASLLERLRIWCKSRFGMWITHNTAKGAVNVLLEAGRLKP
jgi:hypothetical protein